MNPPRPNPTELEALREENEGLRIRLGEAEQTLNAIRQGAVDALVIAGPNGDNIFTLAGADQNYRLLIESIDEGALTVTKDSMILYSNPKFAEMVKQPIQTIIGQPVASYLKADERTGFEIFLRDGAAHSGKKEVTLIGADGSELSVQLSVGLLEAEGLMGRSIILTDLTQTKMAATLRNSNDELNRSNAELARFAYVASHDLKEPLRVVSNYVQMLQRASPGSPDPLTMKYMRFITESVDRMYALIDDLLSYSSVGANPDEKKWIDLNGVVGEALLNLDTAIKDCGAQVIVPPLPGVIGDRSHLLQLFQNLIGNAIKYRGEIPPEISIGHAEEKGETVFSVCDNGIGIDSIHFERIFVLFQRLHERAKYSGTGIGLAVCKKIVDRVGGRIWVESTLGKGSTFFFALPKIFDGNLSPSPG